MANLIVICGPQAVGKMTVAESLRDKLKYNLMTNHDSIEISDKIFGFGTPAQKEFNAAFRERAFELAVKHNVDLLFTYVCAFDVKEEREYLTSLADLFQAYGGNFYFVELSANLETRLERNETPHRLEMKPSKRNIEWSKSNLLHDAENYRLNSYTDEFWFEKHIKIDNTNLDPDEVADMVIKKFNLVAKDKEEIEYRFEVGISTRAVIFDMDGVIFDSERAVYEGWTEVAKKYHMADLEQVYVKCIGVNSKITKDIFLEHYGENFPYDQYKAEQSRNYHAKYDGGHLPLKPGIKELLVALKSRGVKTAVASSTRTALVEQQIRENGLGEYFDVIVGGDMVEKSKPEPDIFLKAANLLGVSCECCYVIEDSYNGIRGADAAGMIPIMVPDMLEPNGEMRQKAKYILKDLYEVEKILIE